MSTSYGVYIGPYAMCKVGKTVNMVLIRTCTNSQCRNQRDDIELTTAYCPSCGSPVGKVGHQVTVDTVDADDLREVMSGVLTNPTGGYSAWAKEQCVHLWIPNEQRMSRNGNLIMQIDFALRPIESHTRIEEINEFRTVFRDELYLLRHRYGADTVTVHWGILQDYN